VVVFFASFRRWRTLRLQPRFAIPVDAIHPHINDPLALYQLFEQLAIQALLQLSFMER
ncbi:unnamed protein product, partial [marine sediment metagenome]